MIPQVNFCGEFFLFNFIQKIILSIFDIFDIMYEVVFQKNHYAG